jgi:hypothetical protein
MKPKGSRGQAYLPVGRDSRGQVKCLRLKGIESLRPYGPLSKTLEPMDPRILEPLVKILLGKKAEGMEEEQKGVPGDKRPCGCGYSS